MTKKKSDAQLMLEMQLKELTRKEQLETKKKPKSKLSLDIDNSDEPMSPPQPTPEMFYGLAGEVGLISSRGSETNPVSSALAFLSFFSANAGRDSFLKIKNTIHHPRIFTLHIGRSSIGGKGESMELTHIIRSRLEKENEDLVGQTHEGGLSSGEGLISLIHDGFMSEPAINDKRLWIVESEFANTVTQGARKGNSLSSTIRNLWDGKSQGGGTKSNKTSTTDPHVSFHGCVTPSELKAMLSNNDILNGFSNRFIMIHAENIAYVPNPKETPEHEVVRLVQRTKEVIQFALGDYPTHKNTKQIQESEDALEFFAMRYKAVTKPFNDIVLDGILSRRRSHTRRLAMLFALLDKTRVIEVKHYKAAFAWEAYTTESVKYIFNSERRNKATQEKRANANKIMEYLEEKNSGASKTDISNECFKRHLDALKINEALSSLLSEAPPLIEKTEVKINNSNRKKIIYKMKSSANSANSANYQETQGLEDDLSIKTAANSCEFPNILGAVKNENSQEFAGKKQPIQASNPHEGYNFANSQNSHVYFSEEPQEEEEINLENASIL